MRAAVCVPSPAAPAEGAHGAAEALGLVDVGLGSAPGAVTECAHLSELVVFEQ